MTADDAVDLGREHVISPVSYVLVDRRCIRGRMAEAGLDLLQRPARERGERARKMSKIVEGEVRHLGGHCCVDGSGASRSVPG